MLFSAASFARHVPTAIAAPTVTRTRRAAARKNFVARPTPRGASLPVAAIAAAVVAAGARGGAGSGARVTRVASSGAPATRVDSDEIARRVSSVPVAIVVGRRVILPVLILVPGFAP